MKNSTVLDFDFLVCFLLVPSTEILHKYDSNILNLGDSLSGFLQVQIFCEVYIYEWICEVEKLMHLVWQVISFAYICFNWVLKATITKNLDVPKIFNTLKYMQSFAQKYFSKSWQYSSSCLPSFLFQICGYKLKQTWKGIPLPEIQ